ncbi:MAG: hypothetical protein JJU05_18680 [Verrucomicrobia bacterium]|nr:hypothetical protein [Verrucomicrobiota bacterium]MCH8528873.1 hypothetical protein [Kiritimatiellia bacterium]
MTDNNENRRREFPTSSADGGMSPYFDKGGPLTISMWDFSWLKGHHAGGPYEDLGQRVEEAAERGYNTLRIDCFPSHILEGKSTFKKKFGQSSIIPCWGDTLVSHEQNVLEKVAELAEHCRKHGIWLGLDSWDKAHMIGHTNPVDPQDEEKTFRGFSQTWVKAIRLMREEGILERAVWIAPMNEVPHYASRNLSSVRTAGKKDADEGETSFESKEDELNVIFNRINHWMGEAIREEVGPERIPLSYSSLGAEHYGKRLTDIYDVVDVHFMPNAIGRSSTRFDEMENWDLKQFSDEWQAACRENYKEMIARTREYFTRAMDRCTTDSGKKLVPIVTESFGPCYFPDHAVVDWTWYKLYNSDAARVIASMPYAGTTLSNYAEPLFRLWEDADWHRNSNLYITAMAEAAR